MEGVTGMIARLRHVPGCSRGGLYGPANIDFRFVGQADSCGCNEPNAEYGTVADIYRDPSFRGGGQVPKYNQKW